MLGKISWQWVDHYVTIENVNGHNSIQINLPTAQKLKYKAQKLEFFNCN